MSPFLEDTFKSGTDVLKGEEPGMLGSGVVASQYKAAGKSVRAMLQMDMVGE